MRFGGRALQPGEVTREAPHDPQVREGLGAPVEEPREARDVVVDRREHRLRAPQFSQLESTAAVVVGEQAADDVKKRTVLAAALRREAELEQRDLRACDGDAPLRAELEVREAPPVRERRERDGDSLREETDLVLPSARLPPRVLVEPRSPKALPAAATRSTSADRDHRALEPLEIRPLDRRWSSKRRPDAREVFSRPSAG